ncbi:OsmC family protein [Sphingobacterium sp. Mn56C]|uniref:OsmC family protein n=1 Tax=Sphingobacterium sp. Mn56C TaxID=3395261 RepID=UPI003BC942B7
MTLKHYFKAHLAWLFKTPASDRSKRQYTKSHTLQIDGKVDLHVSAAKAFKGDPSLHNPEDLLLSSLMSCHMMSYLYVTSQHSIDMVAYSDQAEAILESYTDGSGKIVQVNLNPIVKLADAQQIDLALSLHQEAHRLCFIANSCNFKVEISPRCILIA